eukprot:228462_1
MALEIDLSLFLAVLMACLVYPDKFPWYQRKKRIKRFALKFRSIFHGTSIDKKVLQEKKKKTWHNVRAAFHGLNSRPERTIAPNTNETDAVQVYGKQIEAILPSMDKIASDLSLRRLFDIRNVISEFVDIEDCIVPVILFPDVPSCMDHL